MQVQYTVLYVLSKTIEVFKSVFGWNSATSLTKRKYFKNQELLIQGYWPIFHEPYFLRNEAEVSVCLYILNPKINTEACNFSKSGIGFICRKNPQHFGCSLFIYSLWCWWAACRVLGSKAICRHLPKVWHHNDAECRRLGESRLGVEYWNNKGWLQFMQTQASWMPVET